MASKAQQDNTETTETSTDEWAVVDEGLQPVTITFDTIGDTFIGRKIRSKVITDPNKGDTWTQFHFAGVSPGEVSGEVCAINASTRLAEALSEVPDGALTRVEFTD